MSGFLGDHMLQSVCQGCPNGLLRGNRFGGYTGGVAQLVPNMISQACRFCEFLHTTPCGATRTGGSPEAWAWLKEEHGPRGNGPTTMVTCKMQNEWNGIWNGIWKNGIMWDMWFLTSKALQIGNKWKWQTSNSRSVEDLKTICMKQPGN